MVDDLLKITLTPLLITTTSLVDRRWGHHVGGWLAGFPLTSGPIALFLTLEHGRYFATHACLGILAGTASQLVFALAYRATPHRRWPLPLTAGSAAFAVATTSLSLLHWPPWPTFALVIVSLTTGYLLTRLQPATPHSPEHAPRPTTPPAWDLALRAISATVLVVAITSLAPLTGPRLAGLLAPFPVFGAVLAVFTHHRTNHTQATSILDGLILGWYTPTLFFLTLTLALPAQGLAAFLLATGVAFATALATRALLPRRAAPASPEPTR